MNKVTKTLAGAVFSVFAMTSVASASWVSETNAKLNSPETKAAYLEKTCRSSEAIEVLLCDTWKREGVPDVDVRVALIGGGLVLGGIGGMAAASVPMFAGKTAVSQLGITSIFGYAPTVAVMGVTGAVTGALVGGVIGEAGK